MNKIKRELLNVLLFPVRYYERLEDKKITLYAGILLVGVIDLLLPDVAEVFKKLFTDRPSDDIFFNAVILALAVVLVGIIDVLFVGLPLYDFFNYLKKKETGYIHLDSDKGDNMIQIISNAGNTQHKATAVKVMKVYIMSHFLIIPVNTAMHFAFFRNLSEGSPEWVQNLVLAYSMIISIWSAAIMSRGINTLFRFNPIFKRLTFIVVYIWNFLFGMVFDFQILKWVSQLFR